jgi:two-component system response regulator AtoC
MPRILLAEDDKNFGFVLKGALEEDGLSVDLVPDGVEAVAAFMDKPYDFVLLDIKMPKLDGISALRLIKKVRPDVPSLTFSGNAGSTEMLDSIKAGSHRCLAKPFQLSELKDEIKKYLKFPHAG